jgi:hypothetical protein
MKHFDATRNAVWVEVDCWFVSLLSQSQRKSQVARSQERSQPISVQFKGMSLFSSRLA